jgi:Cu2+-exporting ATPase
MLIRSSTFLERATRIRRVVLDKTGTLTTGALTVADEASVRALCGEDARALYDLAVRSSHPKASAVLAAFAEETQNLRADANVEEVVGKGLTGSFDGHTYRLGSPAWLGLGAPCDLAFSRDGQMIATFTTVEDVREDAPDEVRALIADGIECAIATGDERGRALAVAEECGIDERRVWSELSPAGKAELLRRIDREDTLMIGDGMNDALALRTAWCSGTLSTARTFLAARSDFFLLAPGLGPIRAGLVAARALRRAVRRNLMWATAYNAIALGLSFGGLMSPLLAAILMPLSSLVSIGLVLWALARKGLPWKS